MWHFEALTICSKCFPYLFSLLDSNTRKNSASTKPGFRGKKNSTHPSEKKFINMGKEEKTSQHNTSLNNQNQTGKAPGGEESTDPAKKQEPAMKKDKAKGDPKTGQEEESHTCCGCRFPLLLSLLQLVLGISITVLGFIMAGISSSFLVRDTPYWAGIIICMVSLVGLVTLCISYQPDEKTCMQFAAKLMYFLLSTTGLITCVLAVAFAAHHYLQITQFTCDTILNTCHCKLDTSDPLSRTFVYQDVSDCTSVTSAFNLYLLLQMVLNLIAAIVCLVACFVMWKHRYQVFYVGTRSYSLTSTEIQQQKV
ncbi:PREDICTED: sarcospan [Gavialis gangeticus]|uniref:sarcospan n=1 Tax=Gavialis gangeticus TaxID=94835 RepID=UPI00092FBCF3|nr:PREDICTED: sarcospan [Gavialis gangeticus]